VTGDDGADGHPELGRAERLASSLGELGVDALLVESVIDLRYLTGFTGSHGLALLVGESARARIGGHRFLTDFRYTTQSAEQVPQAFEREIVSGELLEALAALLADTDGRLGFDEAHLTVRGHRRLGELLPQGWELVPCAGAVERLRAVKEAGEVERIRAAASWVAPSATWRSSWSRACAASAPRRRAFPRSSRLGLTAHCRTPRRAMSRSPATCW